MNSPKKQRTRVVVQTPTKFLQSLHEFIPREKKFMYKTTTQLEEFVELIDGDSRIQLVDATFSSPWYNYNTNQLIVVDTKSGDYFIIRNMLPEGFLGTEDDIGEEISQPMVVARAKKQSYKAPHDCLVGANERICFDLRGNFIWMNDERFLQGGKVYFPRVWAEETEETEGGSL